MKQFCVAAGKSASNSTLLRVRNASVLATHHPAAAAAAYAKPISMVMDPLQYILHRTDTPPSLPASNARKLAMAIAAQQQQQQQQHMVYARHSNNAETTKILSVQPQPHGHTIEVEMSASDLQRMLQRVSATRHSQQPYCTHVENAATANAEPASQNGKQAANSWLPLPSALLLLSAALGTGGVLLEIASSPPQAATTAFILDPAFTCNALPNL
ncbi:hypothetical protein EV183_005182 [Coemansia sp. RSA 2336]|nr:hypothetical protein EV183_005182 [Coemansia sp. RSA 2336]